MLVWNHLNRGVPRATVPRPRSICANHLVVLATKRKFCGTDASGFAGNLSGLPRSFYLRSVLMIAMVIWIVTNPGMSYSQRQEPADRFGRQLKMRQEDRSTNGRGRQGDQNFRPRKKTEMPNVWEEFRFFDGSGNNLLNPNWGKSRIALRRMTPSRYDDRISSPARSNGPNARQLSNLFCSQRGSTLESRGLSDMAWQWGQFLDHDITLVETALPSEPFPILIPTGDVWFDPDSTGGFRLYFYRSEYFPDATFPRQQINSNTSWIDGSQIYGSDEETANLLRTFIGGQMRVSSGDMLPIDDEGFFVAGDIRVNEQVGLTAMHTLFVREHNRIAKRLGEFHPAWSDEELFQKTRKEVVGILQSITYNEFLPAILGPDALPRYQGYSPDIDGSMTNEFATAAFRFGHSMLNENLLRLNVDGQSKPGGALPLRYAFFNPTWLQVDGVDPYLQGLTVQQAQQIDTQMVDDVRNFLFGAPGAGGLDLGAFNIQRGRDHGLAGYNEIRARRGLGRIADFSELPMELEMQQQFESIYDSPDDIDPWVGMLAESHLPGSSVGPTMHSIMVEQFIRLRDGDRFWYQRMMSPEQLQRVENTRLAQVIYRNSGVRNLQRNVFFVP